LQLRKTTGCGTSVALQICPAQRFEIHAGEEIADALTAAKALETKKIAGVLTHLGENIRDIREAEDVRTTT